MIVEGLDGEQRREVDEFLAGPRERRRRSAADVAALGGDVVPARREVTT